MLNKKEYAVKTGFNEVGIYLYDRYNALSDQYRSSRRYVSLHTENRCAFSDEFASIMLNAGAVFGSAMLELLKVADRLPEDDPKIGHYSKFLLDEIPDLQSYSVRVRSYFHQRRLLPFQDMTETTSPKWWSAHNKLKHDNQPNYRLGNLENCLNSLAAVVLLSCFVGQLRTDDIFSGVGSKFDPANPGEEGLLFPPEQ
jgi:hypothetical protein